MRIFLFFSLTIRTSRLSLNERKRHSLIKINFHYSFFFIINRRLKEKRKENYFKRMRFLIKKKEETLSMALSFHYMRAITSLLFLIKESLGDPGLAINFFSFNVIGEAFFCPSLWPHQMITSYKREELLIACPGDLLIKCWA